MPWRSLILVAGMVVVSRFQELTWIWLIVQEQASCSQWEMTSAQTKDNHRGRNALLAFVFIFGPVPWHLRVREMACPLKPMAHNQKANPSNSPQRQRGKKGSVSWFSSSRCQNDDKVHEGQLATHALNKTTTDILGTIYEVKSTSYTISPFLLSTQSILIKSRAEWREQSSF